MRRELNDVERRMVEKSVVRIKEELKHLEYLEEYNLLMINKGLEMNYKEKKREFKQMNEQIMVDVEDCWHKLAVLQEQLDKGVEVKEESKVEGMFG